MKRKLTGDLALIMSPIKEVASPGAQPSLGGPGQGQGQGDLMTKVGKIIPSHLDIQGTAQYQGLEGEGQYL